jgi:hypothetical protein
MLSSTIPSKTLVNYQAVQSWVFIGNLILEDLAMVFKLYQILDCKSWYSPLEIDDLQGFISLIEETKSENKINNFELDEDDDDDNNNNFISYPERSNVGEKKKMKRSSDNVDLPFKERTLSPERICNETKNNNNNNIDYLISSSSNVIFVVWLSRGSFRWFRNIQNIGCILSGDGLYKNCTGTAPLIQAIAKVQRNLEATEIVITEESIASDNDNTVSLYVSGFGEG